MEAAIWAMAFAGLVACFISIPAIWRFVRFMWAEALRYLDTKE